jgi:hypothetical protein
MYGSFTYGQSEYGGLRVGNNYPYYMPVFETFILSEQMARGSVTRTFQETITLSEVASPSRTRTFLEEFTMSDSVRPILNGQTAVWIRIPKGDNSNWINLPKN